MHARGVVLVGLAGCQVVFGVAPSDAPALDPDLVAWYRMEEVEGRTLVDSARDHAALGVALPPSVDGKFGGALNFAQDIFVASGPDLATTTGFTVSAWVYVEGLPPTSYGCVAAKRYLGDVENSWELCLRPTATGPQPVFLSRSPDGAFDSLFSDQLQLPLGAWHHLAIRWDGAVKTLALDNVVVASRAAPIGFDDRELLIGGDIDEPDGATSFFDGRIDDLRIYARVLSTAELAQLADETGTP